MSFPRILTALLLLLPGMGIAQTSWQPLANPGAGLTAAYYSIHFLNNDVGIVTGYHDVAEEGLGLITHDGGVSWNFERFSQVNFNAGIMFGDSVAVMAGSLMGSAFFTRTTDGGQTWTDQINGNYPVVTDLAHVVGPVAYAALQTTVSGDSGGVFKTTDGGQSWNKIWEDAVYPVEITFADEAHGLMAAISNQFSGARIFATADSGQSFTLVDSHPISIGKMDLSSGGMSFALSGGGPKFISQTTDFGATWSARAAINLQPAYGTAVRDNFTGMAFGPPDRAMLTSDGGASWQTDTLGSSSLIFAGDFSPDYAYLCGNYGLILKKSVGGMTEWETQETPFRIYGFPNPFTSQLNFSIVPACPKGGTLMVFDMAGKCVFERIIGLEKVIAIDTRYWKPGIYVCKVVLEYGSMWTEKLVKPSNE